MAEAPPTVLHLARVTIEAASPLSLASGDDVQIKRKRRKDKKEEEEDAQLPGLMRDANGLPVVPGSSTQGALRSLYAGNVNDLFGYAQGDKIQAGRLVVGFGYVHDSKNEAAHGLLDEKGRADTLLTALRRVRPQQIKYSRRDGDSVAPSDPNVQADAVLLRDHVRLNGRHVVEGRKKFERLAVPTGTRFSFELALWGVADKAGDDRKLLQKVIAAITNPAFRLGGAGRRGYGKVKLVKASYAKPALGNWEELLELRGQPPSKHFSGPGAELAAAADGMAAGVATATLTLTPINPWRIGGTTPSMTDCGFGPRLPDGSAPPPLGLATNRVSRRGKPSEAGNDIVPRDSAEIMTIAREPRIGWSKGTGQTVAPAPRGPFEFIVPGSALKGPLAHRALFHWNRMHAAERMIDASALDGLGEVERAAQLAKLKAQVESLSKRPPDLEALLGAEKESATGGRTEEKGNASRVYFDDAAVRDVIAVQGIDHISIDRFTGGVRPSYLYVEEVLVGGRIEATLTILPPIQNGAASAWSADVVTAFCHALRDLCGKRLAIGAKSLGFCIGDVAWAGPGRAEWEAAWEATGAHA